MTAQDQSEIFGGSNEQLKKVRSSDGNDTRSVPAFVFGEELATIADTDSRAVVLTADLGRSNRATDFAARHPERFVNTGIAEKNMITTAAGMAAAGMVPFAATFASFAALLGCEQIRTDCAYPGLPVRVIGHHSGMSMGFYGTSHHALEDIGVLRTIADLTVVCATDANHLRAILRASMDHPGAMYIRLGRGRDPEVYPDVPEVRFGAALQVRDGHDATIIATGSEVSPALHAAGIVANDGISVRVVDMHTVSHPDRAVILAAAKETGAVLTVEEHNVTGGLGEAVAVTLFEAGVSGVRFRRHGVPDRFVEVGPPAALYAQYGLDASGIASTLRELLS